MTILIAPILSKLNHIVAKLAINKPKKLVEAHREVQLPFTPLSPVDDADPTGEYASALTWALRNPKQGDIKNIALAGPYGSGKSSILKTYQNKNTDPTLVFLNISLATFKEEASQSNKGDTNPNDKNNKEASQNSLATGNDLLRLIELSILQQIFYHEEDHKIPDSRFKKIRSFSQKSLRYSTIGLALVLASVIHLYDKSFYENITGYYALPFIKIMFNLLSVVIVAAGITCALYKSIRTISSITISKLNFQNTEIQISDSISKSILNNHLDEILYFFEVTNYTVVVIEDLDRFEQTEIFTKLRELNQLINYSKKIKRQITFIYAIRDDIFKDKDRTKFFDFIIPVIPVINSSNSNEKLLNIVNKNSYDVKPELIENISLFIDDLRLLYNIANEYHVYRLKLGNLNQNKLFAMMVYKNIYPDDFVELSNGDGKLFSVFEKKEAYIRNQISEFDLQIQNIQLRLKVLDSAMIDDKRELRMIYVYKILESLSNFKTFVVSGTDQSLSQITDDDIFENFLNDKMQYTKLVYNSYYQRYNPATEPIPTKFADFESQVSEVYTYRERLKIIDDRQQGRQEELKSQIRKLESEKTKVRHYKLHEIIASGGFTLNFENKHQSQLVNVLLRNGYIGEDYLDYISIFYEGSITKSDREFLLNVKGQTPSEFDFKLTKLDKLISKIDLIDFTSSNILNYSMLDYLLDQDDHTHQLKSILTTLVNESPLSISFIDGFIDKGEHIEIFIRQLAKVWPGIWHFLSQRSNFPNERLDLYLRILLAHADLDDIKVLAGKSDLATRLSAKADFLEIPIEGEKLKQIIAGLKIKFTSLDFEHAPKTLCRFVYEQNYYALTEQMTEAVIKNFGKYNKDDFDTRNFYAVLQSECDHLLAYINHNMNAYIEKLYLPMPKNTLEEEDALTELLNQETMSPQLRELILDKVTTKVSDINAIDDLDVTESLFNRSKVDAVWENLISFYSLSENSMKTSIIDFVNVSENSKLLSESKIKINKPEQEIKIIQSFVRHLLLEEGFSYDAYRDILKSIPYIYQSLDVSGLTEEKVSLLINHDILKMTVANYDLLRANFDELHMELAERKHTEFIRSIKDFVVEEPDAFYLISSDNLSVEQKNAVIEKIGSEMIGSSIRLLELSGAISSDNERLNIPINLLVPVLSSALPLTQRIRLLNRHFPKLNREEIFIILLSMPEPYSDIAVFRRRPTLDDTPLNRELASKLVNYQIIKSISNDKGRIRISTFRQ
jgi:hypothetical protein